jgi:phage-related protein
MLYFVVPWTIWQYKNIIESFVGECAQGMQEMFERRLDLLRQKGTECRRPITDSIGDGLFELRARSGKTQGRLIFYFAPNRKIIFIHAFYKPGRKIDPAEKSIAQRKRTLASLEIGNVSPYIN